MGDENQPLMGLMGPNREDTLSASLAVEQQHQAAVDLVKFPFFAAEV